MFSTQTNKQSSEPIPVDGGPGSLAITPDGRQLYVAKENSVSVINTATHREGGTGARGHDLAVTPDGHYVYVVGSDVSVINTANNSVVKTIPVGANPHGVAVSRNAPTAPGG